MRVRNPSGRAIRLEILAGDDAAMALTIGPHAAVDLGRYQRALDELARLIPEGAADDPAAAER